MPTAAVEVGAVRWVVPAPAEPVEPVLIRTESRHGIPATVSREPVLVTSSSEPRLVIESRLASAGEVELVPLGSPG